MTKGMTTMTTMNKHLAVLLICSASILAGCSKQEDAAAPQASGSGAAVSAAPAAVPKEAVSERAAIPTMQQADKSKPLNEYQELTNGRTLLFVHLSVDTMPLDYPRIASLVSAEYSKSKDEFRKNDLLTALRPGIDAEIAKARANRYYQMTGEVEIEKYDFETKSFRLGTFSDAGSHIYFNDIKDYSIAFINARQFQQLRVEDEAQARRVEAVRAETGAGANALAKAYAKHKLFLTIYFFAAEAKLGQPVLLAEVTKVQLRDENGNLLAEM